MAIASRALGRYHQAAVKNLILIPATDCFIKFVFLLGIRLGKY